MLTFLQFTTVILALYVMYLHREIDSHVTDLKEMQEAMLCDQTLRNVLAQFSEQDFDLPLGYVHSLLDSVPLDKVPPYVKEIDPKSEKSDVKETNVFGQVSPCANGLQILILSGLREVLAHGSMRYIPVCVIYSELLETQPLCTGSA